MNKELCVKVVELWDNQNYRDSLDAVLDSMFEKNQILGYQLTFPGSQLIVHFGSETSLAKVVHMDGRMEMVTYGMQEEVVNHARKLLLRGDE